MVNKLSKTFGWCQMGSEQQIKYDKKYNTKKQQQQQQQQQQKTKGWQN